MAGWKHGELKSLDRFADICVEYAGDNDGFLVALGDEYGIKGSTGAVTAFRVILAEIANNVADELTSILMEKPVDSDVADGNDTDSTQTQ